MNEFDIGSNQNSLFVFRRDLRLEDNSGLIKALNSSKNVMPIFILDQYLIGNKNLSFNAKQFLKESLIDLIHKFTLKKAQLFIHYGKPPEIISNLLKRRELNIDKLIMNRDYTPYSQIRDSKIDRICKENRIKLVLTADLLLNEPEVVIKSDGTPYTIFTPFFKKSQQYSINKPEKISKDTNYYSDDLSDVISAEKLKNILNYHNSNIYMVGGRSHGIKILNQIHEMKDYGVKRDFPALKGTTNLSAHLKFGTVSIREVYHAINQTKNFTLLRQLYWRDFYVYIGYHFPHVFKGCFRPKYNKLDWNYNKILFQAWCEGKTGFPIVDAGMRQLNSTGWMHNRVRMIVASFLTKDLLINWQWGERYFAEKLVDYDISVNNGNWQWAASTGCDPVPYFRIFNPWLQQKKFDPQSEYIKRFIPELRDYNPKLIHNLFKTRPRDLTDYPKPIVDHSIMREKAKIMFKTI
ncbi:MAG: cryptochrome/photolyase family protein [Promethearchaeota archaeon]